MGQYDASRRPNDGVFCPLRRKPMLSAFRSSLLSGRKPHPSQVKLARLARLARLAQQICYTARSHLASFNMVPMCFGALREHPPSTMALIGNARQATSEGESGPVETGLTGPAATALFYPWLLPFSSPLILWCSGVAKLGHTGARALATRGCAPPVQALLKNYRCRIVTRN